MKGTIDGIEVYLDEDQLPAFTLSVNSLADPSKVQGVRSTTIRIIATPEARRVLGTEYMAQVKRGGARPVLRIGDGDVDVFRAEVVPVKWTRDVIECLAVGGNASWFEYANGVDLRKYNYPLGPVVNAANIIDSWTNGEIIIWPLINYNNQFDEYLDTDDIMVTELRPGVRIGLLIADLMAAGGWTVKPEGVRAKRDWGKYCLQSDTSKARVLGLPTVAPGAVLSLPDAQELVASYQSESNPPFAALMTMNVYGTAPGQMCVWGPDAPPISVGRQVLAGSPGGNPGWLGALCRYRMPEDGFLRVSNCNFPLGLDVAPSAGEEYRLVMWDVTDGVELGFLSYVTNGAEPADSIGARYIYFTGDFPLVYLLKDHEVVFGYAQTSTSGTAQAFSAFPASSGAGTVANIRVEVDYIEGSELVIESIAPDGSLANVMKGIANAQSLLFVTDPESRMIEVWADEDYYSRSPDVTRDWTGRLDFTTAPERINPIAPRSLSLRYKDDDKDAGLAKLMRVTRNKYGNSSAPMPRGVADEQVIEIPWSASDMRRVIAINNGGTLIPQCVLPSVMNGGTEPYGITTRLLIADGVAQGQWTFDGVALSEYPRVYFLLPGSDMVPLAFGNPTLFGGLQPTVMEEQWKARLSRLRDSDALECFAHLRDNELQNFDFGMPTLVDDGSGPAWYWVQEIRDHRFGAGLPTKVTLVKIPGMEYQPPANPPVEFPEPPEPFASPCTQPTSLHIVVPPGESIDTIVLDVSDEFTGHFMIEGDPTVHASGDFDVSLSSGEYCLYTTDASGVPNGAATIIYLYANSLTTLDVSAWTAATTIYLYADGLTALDVSAWTAATTIYLYANGLTALDVSAWTAATYIELYANSLTALDVSAWTAATYIYLYANGLTTLDVSAWTAATTIYLTAIGLTALDVSAWTAATTIYLYANSLTTLVVPSVLATVTVVRASACHLDQESVDAILAAAVANPAITSALFDLGGSCAAPSSAGYADKTTLQARGCTVYTN